MNLREKYGEWGLILGATEGVGKAFCEKIAAGGMNVVMVGRREEKLNVLAGEIRETYGVETKVVRADFSQPGAAETVFAATGGLDMGFMSYVACLHSFGKIQDTPWEKHEAMINVNVVTFLKCFHHYMRIFAAQDRGRRDQRLVDDRHQLQPLERPVRRGQGLHPQDDRGRGLRVRGHRASTSRSSPSAPP